MGVYACSWLFMFVHCCHGCLGCSWLFIAAMVVHCRHGCLSCHVVHARSWLQWMFVAVTVVLVVHGYSWLFMVAMVVHCRHGCLGCSCRSCPFVVAMAGHGYPIHSWPSQTFPAISRPALRLWIPSYLFSGMEPYTIIRFGTIGYRRVRAHRLVYGLGPSAIARRVLSQIAHTP